MKMSRPISYPRVEGIASRQAHVDLPEGTFERELGREGFFGAATQMYHAHAPTGWVSWEGPLRPRAFDLTRLNAKSELVWDAPVVLRNPHVSLRWWRPTRSMDYLARNADGDDLIFVHRGRAQLFCDYGHLEIAEGDYVRLPRATMWRIEMRTALELLLIECTNSEFQTPERGIVGRHALYDEAVLDVPRLDEAFRAQQTESTWRVLIKRQNEVSTVTYPFSPLDALGWHGDLSVVRLNVKDIRPLVSHRYHLPPSAHSTWVGNRFIVCTFVPRPIETDPRAIKVPFFHNNDDFDEVVFYHHGSFFSRDDIRPGMLTWHPCGFTHGPHPKSLQRMYDASVKELDEYAVMVDTRDSLEQGAELAPIENQAYVNSWRTAEPQKAPRPALVDVSD